MIKTYAFCLNCNSHRSDEIYVRGLCPRCYSYQRRNGGRMRPQVIGPMDGRGRKGQKKPHGLCKNCHKEVIRNNGLCSTCYQYRRKNGRSRPKFYFRESCRTCKRPRSGYQDKTRLVKGECMACWNYRRQHGIARPEELIKKKAPCGWCECGEPAIASLIYYAKAGADNGVPVCRECLELEERIE